MKLHLRRVSGFMYENPGATPAQRLGSIVFAMARPASWPSSCWCLHAAIVIDGGRQAPSTTLSSGAECAAWQHQGRTDWDLSCYSPKT